LEYIIIYHTGTSNNTKLARLEAEDIRTATEKTQAIFNDLKQSGAREHFLVEVLPLNGIRKLDALE
jgi:hypothetical protein